MEPGGWKNIFQFMFIMRLGMLYNNSNIKGMSCQSQSEIALGYINITGPTRRLAFDNLKLSSHRH